MAILGWLALFVAFRGFAGGIYWTDRGASTLMTMRFDGTALHSLALSGAVTDPGTNLRGIAVDPSREELFWADNGRDQIHRARTDGSNSRVFVSLPGGNSFPADVRLDATRGLLYWCDQTQGVIQRASLDTTNVVDLITNAAPSGPYFLDLEPTEGKLYWGDFSGGAIYRARLDGSARETLLTGNASTRGVRLDPLRRQLYWLDRDRGRLLRCPLTAFDQGPITVEDPRVQVLYTNLDTPHGLALDANAGKLYWADTGTNPGSTPSERAINRGDVDGATPLETLATGSEPWDLDLDLRCTDYAQWRARYFRRDAPPTETDPNADPDQDGVVNALEYAHGTHPRVPDADARPRAELVPGSNALFPGLRFRQRAPAGDLRFQVHSATQVAPWTPEAPPLDFTLVGESAAEEGIAEVLWRATVALAERPAHFLRVEVELTLTP